MDFMNTLALLLNTIEPYPIHKFYIMDVTFTHYWKTEPIGVCPLRNSLKLSKKKTFGHLSCHLLLPN